jgi:hypothetical protein
MINFWFHPTWSGDFRLIKTGEFSCELTVVAPTPGEIQTLTGLMTAAKANGWLMDGQDDDFIAACQSAEDGESMIPILAPIEKAGPLVSGSVHGDASLWTAVRHEDGQVVVVSGSRLTPELTLEADPAPLQIADPSPQGWDRFKSCEKCEAQAGAACLDLRSKNRELINPHKGRELTEAAVLAAGVTRTAVAAATVREPRRGCPAPTRCNRRASEVLRVFSSQRQSEQFEREGFMRVIGNRTGSAYRVYHRDEAAARGLTHSLIEARSGHAICVWDDRVPPEEEALAIKLAVEHREGWLMRLPRGPARLTDPRNRYTEDWGDGRRVVPVVGSTPFDR